jgi:hypothetical protein
MEDVTHIHGELNEEIVNDIKHAFFMDKINYFLTHVIIISITTDSFVFSDQLNLSIDNHTQGCV